jgi:hypothetical protein
MTIQRHASGTGKVRRDVTGGKRGFGNSRDRAIRRPDARKIRSGAPDPSLTALGGLVSFGAFLREIGVDRELSESFAYLKSSRSVIYPMAAQMRLLLDMFVAGEHRVFGLEALSADPLFVYLAGGGVPSIDTVYRDLARNEEHSLAALDEMVAKHGLIETRARRWMEAHVDIDTTVAPVFGEHEGARPGPNPSYHGRRSYHPVLARIAESDTVIAAQLRPGDTSFGVDEVPFVQRSIRRARSAVGPHCLLYVRIDGAADCTQIMTCIAAEGAFFLTKARMSMDLCLAIARTTSWRTVDRDAMDRPTRQVAEIEFARQEWTKAGLPVRVIAVRTRERDNGKQIHLWDDNDYTVQVYLTNDVTSEADSLAWRYNKRAGIEPLIGEFKSAWGIGDVPCYGFDANHAALLLKLLAHNLLRRYVRAKAPALRTWRAPWIRRALIRVPGRVVRSGRSRTLRTAPRPMLPMQN